MPMGENFALEPTATNMPHSDWRTITQADPFSYVNKGCFLVAAQIAFVP